VPFADAVDALLSAVNGNTASLPAALVLNNAVSGFYNINFIKFMQKEGSVKMNEPQTSKTMKPNSEKLFVAAALPSELLVETSAHANDSGTHKTQATIEL
jgi:hypothetical protein